VTKSIAQKKLVKKFIRKAKEVIPKFVNEYIIIDIMYILIILIVAGPSFGNIIV